MCLGVPGLVEETYERETLLMGQVSFGSIRREVCLEHVPEVKPGEYVLVHVGFALCRIDAEEAARTMALLEEFAAFEKEDVDESHQDLATTRGGAKT